MTEKKRFTYIEEDLGGMVLPKCLYDGETVAKSVYECVGLLNALNDENEQLKETNDFLSDFRGFITVDHQKTKEENEKLKSDRVRFEEETRLELTRRLDKVFDCIDKKISDVLTSIKYDDVPDEMRFFTENILIELKKELEE